MAEIRRLAIVNRGEPALRALDAIAELNRDGTGPPITAIVVHTAPDARAWFVRRADEAISLGPATFVDPADGHRKSAYLDEQRVIAALQAVRADAAWVGWGFVAEHASFAQLCEQTGIVFVGPNSETIGILGTRWPPSCSPRRSTCPWCHGVAVLSSMPTTQPPTPLGSAIR
jgi:acetyl/propionyl-CoA carboxylase alpha subunit